MTSAAYRAICLGAGLLAWLGTARVSLSQSSPRQTAALSQDNQPDVASLRNQALEEGEAGKTADAIRDYRRALELQPDWKEGWWNLGMLQYSGKQFDEAESAFQRAASLAPGVGNIWALLGLSEFETGDYDRALQHLEQAQRLGIQDDEEIARVASYHLALLCLWSGQFERATELLRASFGFGSMPPQVRLALGLVTLRVSLLPQQLDPSREALVSETGAAAASGDPERFAELVKEHPNAPNLRLAYGVALSRAGKAEEALEQFRAEAATSPESPLPWMETAHVLIGNGKASDALVSAQRAVRLAPSDPAAHAILADALKAAGKPGLAANELKLATTSPQVSSPPEKRILKYYGRAELAEGSTRSAGQDLWHRALREYVAADYSGAQADLKTWLAGNPSDGTAWALFGLCEFALHDYDDALIHLDRSARLGMNASTESLDQARYTYGILLIHAGRFDEADSVLATAWQPSGPLAAKVEFALGLSLLRRTEFPDSVDPKEADLIRTSGRISTLLQQSEYDRAFPLFKVLIDRYPTVRFLHYAYGTALIAVSEFDQAAVQMQAERTISPTSELPCLGLASMALRQHTPEPALQWAHCALELNRDSVDAHYLLGRALLETGNATEAVTELEVAGKMSPASPEIHFNLARAYAKANMPEKAQQERETFTRLNQERHGTETPR
ncbi:MAG TPA: tetratricopeptide repeat protein [Terracidiphilus sp.]|nr:tetratricopeptide repeat protein [Terracidiphilus sp.]